MTLRLRVRVDEDGNAVVPVGKAFGGTNVDVTLDVAQPTPARAPPGIRPPKIDMNEQDYRTFVQSMYGSYPDDIPEPPDPPATPKEVF